MTIERRTKEILESLRDWTENVAGLVAETDFDTFRTSQLHQLALSKAVEWIGELCGRMIRKSPGYVAAHPEIAFEQAYAMRHRLVHGYEEIDWRTLWDTATISIPRMRTAIATAITQADDRP